MTNNSSTSTRTFVVALLILATGFSATAARADDKSAGVVLPGLLSSPAASVKSTSASLKLTAEQVTVTWSLAPGTAKDAALLAHLPRFTWLGEAEPYPDRQFPELLFFLDGTPVKATETFKAFAGATDISELVQSAGFDPFAIADTPPFLTPAKDANALARLQQLGAVEKYGDDLLAKWSAQRNVKLDLKPNAKEVAISYKPRPGYQLTSLVSIIRTGSLAQYCLSAPKLKEALGKSIHGPSAIVTTYAIPVSIDGKPLPSVSADIDLSDPKQHAPGIAVVCGADGIAKIGNAEKVMGSIKPDASGIVRIMSISRPTLPSK